MDRSSIINASKETILAGGAIPATFFVDCSGQPLYSLVALPGCDCCGVTGQHCLVIARRTAQEKCWQYADVNELAFVGIEKPGVREFLVVVFCVPGPEIAFSAQYIEIRRNGANIVLLDDCEVRTVPHGLLTAFLAGLASTARKGVEVTVATFLAKGMTAKE